MKTATWLHWHPRLLAIPLLLAATFSLLYVGRIASHVLALPVVGNSFIDDKLKYQFLTLGLALLVMAVTYLFAPENFRRYFRLGQLNAPSEPVKILGIGASDNWLTIGRSFAVVISLATGAFIYLGVAQGHSLEAVNYIYLPFVLILAALNAFTEESLTRFGVVANLDGVLPRPAIYLVSALVFGIPHFFGVPGGWLGSLMAGFLGWLLAKSVVETRGLFWAWFIHFLQDVIIFAGLFLVAL